MNFNGQFGLKDLNQQSDNTQVNNIRRPIQKVKYNYVPMSYSNRIKLANQKYKDDNALFSGNRLLNRTKELGRVIKTPAATLAASTLAVASPTTAAKLLTGATSAVGFGGLGLGSGNSLKDAGYGMVGEALSPIVGKVIDTGIGAIKLIGEYSGELLNKGLSGAKSLYLNKAVQTFKPNPDAYYRVIGDEPGYLDAINSKIIRPNLNGIFKDRQTYYTKGSINDYSNPVIGGGVKKNTAYKGSYIVEVLPNEFHFPNPVKGLNPEWNFGSTMPGNEIPINSEFVKFYKRFGKLYKQIEVPKNNFKSEIDWGKWNSEIPLNKLLMNEYNLIELTTKQSGTWMKNPDGSQFKGTPELFIQLNSENFKKYFNGSPIKLNNGSPEFMYHGSPNKNIKEFLDYKDKLYIKNPNTTTGEGGIYFSNKKDYADLYLDFGNESSKRIGKTYLTYLAPKTAIKAGENVLDGFESGLEPSFLWTHSDIPVDAVLAGKHMRRLFPEADLEVAMHNKNLIKSAIGNNGMFDITNPNIYKTVAGGLSLNGLNKLNNKK